MNHITTLCFDLDDTLWDMPSAIGHAELAAYEWFEAHCPAVAAAFSVEDLRRLREDIGAQHPECAHDLYLLRRRTYEAAARAVGEDPAVASVVSAVFLEARNAVTLYDDVVPTLKLLHKSHRLLALSNGNANLEVIGIAHFFSGIYSAAGIGAAKPDVKVFHAVSEMSGLSRTEILHIGDDPQNDVVAPESIGMPAVWLNRKGKAWPGHFTAPGLQINGLSELPALLGAPLND